MPNCQYCNSDLSTKSSLKIHQRTSKKCLKIQGIEPDIKYDCDICNKNFLTKVHLQTHIFSCMKNTNYIRNEVQIIEYKYNEIEHKYKELEIKYNLIVVEKKILKQDYDNLFEKITTSALSKTNTVNKHNNTINISTYKIKHCNSQTINITFL